MRTLGGVGLVLALTAAAAAQVPCVRLDTAFSCADGTSLAIYDDPWRGSRGRGGAGLGGEGGFERGGGEWWKDELYVRGPRGERCLVHGNHVHCSGTLTDEP
jgi:hypothetical protein